MQTYLTAINSGAIPTINDAWTEVVESQLKVAAAKAVRFYQKEMKAWVMRGESAEELAKEHKRVKGEAGLILEKTEAKEE